MHRMKSLAAMLYVKTDRIHNAVSASKGVGDGLLIVNVGVDRAKLGIIKSKQSMPPIRMPRRNPNKKPSLMEMPNHSAPEKPGPAEHDDGALVHGRQCSSSLAYVGAAPIVPITWTAPRANCMRFVWIGVSAMVNPCPVTPVLRMRDEGNRVAS